MKIHSSEFYTSSAKVSECPDKDLPEFAFIGRSNVGKSSLINSLCNKKSMAKTSSKPGKTLLINHFIIKLFSALLLIDIRLKPQKIDLEFMEHINKLFVPFILIFTKCDKLKTSEISEKIEEYSEEIKKNWEIIPQIIISSAKNKIGLDEILKFIDKCKQEFKSN